MSRQEDQLAGRIDRQNGRAQTSARTLQIRELARATINCAVMEQPEEDREAFMNASIRHLRALYGAGEGESEAVSLFGSLAWSGALQTRRVVARATAEQEMARITAANDGDAG